MEGADDFCSANCPVGDAALARGVEFPEPGCEDGSGWFEGVRMDEEVVIVFVVRSAGVIVGRREPTLGMSIGVGLDCGEAGEPCSKAGFDRKSWSSVVVDSCGIAVWVGSGGCSVSKG